jgi:hypothetical protein
MKTLYAAAIGSRRDTGSRQSSHIKSATFLASNIQEATGIATDLAHQWYPGEDGYCNKIISVVEVPSEMLLKDERIPTNALDTPAS